MFTVALIGPDGAGKTTIARELERVLPGRAKYVYMGVNWDASGHLLPTTRLLRAIRRARGAGPDLGGPPDVSEVDGPPRPTGRRFRHAAWAGLSLLNRFGEEWYRQALAWWYVRRGTIVVFDRHFFADYYAHDVATAKRRTAGQRLHGFLLSRVYPKPDLVIFLDAPAELLHERKAEGTLEALERRREEYLRLAADMSDIAVIDASRPLDTVTGEVAEVVRVFSHSKSQPLSSVAPASRGGGK